MASVNKVILIGNLGKDPELKYLASGRAVANFSIATTENWKDKDGNRQEKTEWHYIVLWGRTAEVAKEYLSKGSSVYIEGRLQTRTWDDNDGHKHYKTEIVGDRMQFMGSRRDSPSSGPSGPSDPGQPQEALAPGGGGAGGSDSKNGSSSGTAGDDDLPF